MARKRKYRLVIIWALGALLLIAAALSIYVAYQNSLRNKLLASARRLQLSIEQFAADRSGAYPPTLEVLCQEGYLTEMPDSPYGPLKVLEPGDPPRPGSVVYIPQEPVVMFSSDELVDQENGRILYPATHESEVILPTEIDHYMLIVYGPCWSRSSDLRDSLEETTVIVGIPGSRQYKILELDQIAWEHVSFVLTAGEDYPRY